MKNISLWLALCLFSLVVLAAPITHVEAKTKAEKKQEQLEKKQAKEEKKEAKRKKQEEKEEKQEKKEEKQVRQNKQIIRVVRMKYDCYLDDKFKNEKKEYATNKSDAAYIKGNIGECVTTGSDVTDPRYVIRYKAEGDGNLGKAFLSKSDWLGVTIGCYKVTRKLGSLSSFVSFPCENL